LVVGRILPGDGLPVLTVVHKGIEPVVGGGRGGEDHELGIVGVPPDDLLPPVPEQVRRKAGCGLGAVVGPGVIVVGGQEPAGPVPGPLVDHRVVEDLALEVAVPEDPEVARGFCGGQIGALAGVHVARGAPTLETPMVRVDMERQPPPVVAGSMGTPNHLPGPGVPEIRRNASVRGLVLVGHPDFLARSVRIHVRQVQGVPMPETRGVEALAVVVDGAGAVSDLVAPVAVHVARDDGVGSLSGVTAVSRRVGVEKPPLRQLAVAPIHRPERGPGVIAPAEHRAGPLAIQVGRAGQEPVDPVAVVVAPGRHRAAGRVVVDRGHLAARQAVENREVLGPRKDIAGGIAVIRRVVIRGRGTQGKEVTRPVTGPRRGLAHQLGLTIPIIVIDLELGVVRPRSDVDP